MNRKTCLLLVTLLVGSLAGCTTVKVYERARLAHPSMSSSQLGGPGEAHLHAIHEGAVGGAIGVESGCGCN